MAPARENSISAASEKMGCLLMGCSSEEGLHLCSYHDCKLEHEKSIRLEICINISLVFVIFERALLLFCCPAATLHVLCQAEQLYGRCLCVRHERHTHRQILTSKSRRWLFHLIIYTLLPASIDVHLTTRRHTN